MRARAPEPEHAQRGRHVAQAHGVALGQFAAQPRDVARPGAAAGDEQVALVAQARDREVADAAAVVVEHRRVEDAPDRPVHLARAHAVEPLDDARPLGLDLHERREVEDADAGARRVMLAADRRRPVPLRPGRALRHDVGQRQRVVGAEPLRALPAGALGELGAVVEEALVPGRRAHSARVRQHLAGVDDVVDLVVLRAPARLDVERALLEAVQPVGVHRPEVERAAAGRHEVDDGLGGAAAVRDPDAVGQPEAADLRSTARRTSCCRPRTRSAR